MCDLSDYAVKTRHTESDYSHVGVRMQRIASSGPGFVHRYQSMYLYIIEYFYRIW